MLLGLFLLICGAKWWLIDRFGNATPYMDEWDHEVDIIEGYLEHTLSPMQFFNNQNEHRIAFTQALVYFLFRANKQWDPILQMVAQVPVEALAIAALVGTAGKFMSGLGKAALAAFAAGLSILPFGWENTLWGDQSCFYFMRLLGVLTIWLCWRYKALTPRWWLGVSVAIASLYTMAGGVFSIGAVIAFLMLRLRLERGKDWKRQLAGIAILAAIVVFGLATTPNVAAPSKMVASDSKSFFAALSGILSWPCSSHWACFMIQAPLILLGLIIFLLGVPFDDGRWYVIVTGAAFWIHALATSCLRVAGWDASRYRDSWSMLVIVQCACLYFLHRSLGERLRFIVYPIAAVWILVCFGGLLDKAVNLWPLELTNQYASILEMENNVREYLATGDATHLDGQIPYPHKPRLLQRLNLPHIRSVLPSNLISQNPPLTPAKQQAGSGGGFVQNGYPPAMHPLDGIVFGSYGKRQTESKNGISFYFKVPRGTQQVDLEVAGYPNARAIHLKVEEPHGVSYSIAPPLDPGMNWESVTVGLNPKSTFFKISAKDQSDSEWLAFSMPVISIGGSPGKWARSLARDSSYVIDVGLMLLVLGGLGCMREGRLREADGGQGKDELALESP